MSGKGVEGTAGSVSNSGVPDGKPDGNTDTATALLWRSARSLGKRLLNGPVSDLYLRVASRYHASQRRRDAETYVAPLDPFKIATVDPARVTRFTRREFPHWRNRWDLFGAVRGGEWDARGRIPIRPNYAGPPAELYLADRFEETIVHRSLVDHFVDGTPWAETELVRRALAQVGQHRPVWHMCTSERDVWERCRYVDDLFECIRDQGYLTQRELVDRNLKLFTGFRNLVENEVVVDVGRDGELLFVSGRHRLSIAKILDLERVPVVFLVRHADWMARRDEAYRGERIPDHPDLRELGGERSSVCPRASVD